MLAKGLRTAYLLCLVFVLVSAATPRAEGAGSLAHRFAEVIREMLALPYQPAYVPAGADSAFSPALVPNTLPAQDYTTGSVPGDPDAPSWPAAFGGVILTSGDGARLVGMLGLHAGRHPGVVVVHGFNTHGIASVIRWAAMLYANGYNVLAADQRDFSFEYSAGYGYPSFLQTFGWKESEDVVAAGRYLMAQPGVTSVGVVGFSEGAQNTVLAMAGAGGRVFAAGLTFSGPADQNTQIYSTASPPDCQTPLCAYPVTDALVTLVVPPYSYTDVCAALTDAGKYYGIDPFAILAAESPFHAQTDVTAPLLNFYAADDPLVQPFQATMMAGYEGGASPQHTLLIRRGAHAYYYDRWWQQKAILLYFKAMLPGAEGDVTVTTAPTVNQTPGGAPLATQLVDLGTPTRAEADAYLAPYVCDTTRGAPASAP
jgi:predicted alpha/beta-fold hydrolase